MKIQFHFVNWVKWVSFSFRFFIFCLQEIKLSEIIWFLLKNGMKESGGSDERQEMKQIMISYLLEWVAMMKIYMGSENLRCLRLNVAQDQSSINCYYILNWANVSISENFCCR